MRIDSVIAAPGTRPDERDLHNCRNRRGVRLQRLSDDGQIKQKLSSVKDRNNGGMRHLCPRDSRKSRLFRGPAGEGIQPDENDRSPSAGAWAAQYSDFYYIPKVRLPFWYCFS